MENSTIAIIAFLAVVAYFIKKMFFDKSELEKTIEAERKSHQDEYNQWYAELAKEKKEKNDKG